MSEISKAAIPRREESINVLDVDLEVSFALGTMSTNEWNYFRGLFEKGEITPETATAQMVAMDFQWNAKKNGEPIPTDAASLLEKVPQSFMLQTFYEVLNTFAPKEQTSSTSQPGSKQKANGERSQRSKKEHS